MHRSLYLFIHYVNTVCMVKKRTNQPVSQLHRCVWIVYFDGHADDAFSLRNLLLWGTQQQQQHNKEIVHSTCISSSSQSPSVFGWVVFEFTPNPNVFQCFFFTNCYRFFTPRLMSLFLSSTTSITSCDDDLKLSWHKYIVNLCMHITPKNKYWFLASFHITFSGIIVFLLKKYFW